MIDEANIPYIIVGVIVAIFFLSGLRIVRPTHRAAVENFGKFNRFQESGLTLIIPIYQKMYSVNITEQLVDVKRQKVITLDNLNCDVDAQIYYKVGEDVESLKKALYKVNNYDRQIVQLAKTTLRDVIGQKKFEDVNSKRGLLNKLIFDQIKKETEGWGISIIRVELKEIDPPNDVQNTMNDIIKANNTKVAAKDFAESVKIEASGEKRAMIELAQGDRQAQIERATGEAKAITTVAEANAKKYQVESNSLTRHFKGTAVVYKQLETAENSYKDNSKIIVNDPKNPLNIIVGDDSTRKNGKGKKEKIIPIPTPPKSRESSYDR